MRKRNNTLLEYALLGLTSQEPRSGYSLHKVFAETAMGNYSGSPGAVYPALKRLVRSRLMNYELDSSKRMQPKRVYRPSVTGIKALREWIARPIEREDVAKRMGELLLRYAFMGHLHGESVTKRFLRQFSNRVQSYIKELKQQLAAMPRSTPFQARTALQHGIDQYKTSMRWADGILKSL